MHSKNYVTVVKKPRKGFAGCLTGFSFALLLSSCATLNDKLTPSTVADVSFFADQTISMLSSANISMDRDTTVYTREYFDPTDPDEQRLNELVTEVTAVFESIIIYSLNLVTIAETLDTDAERITAYADWLEDITKDELKWVDMDQARHQKLVDNIRAQKTFRESLKAAQTLLYALGIHMSQILTELEEKTEAVALNLDSRIDKEYAKVIEYQEILEEEKYNVLGALKDTYRVFIGEEDAYEDLRSNKAIWNKDLVPTGTPDYKQTKAIADHLLKRLDTMHTIGREIEPDWQSYRATHRELDDLHSNVVNEIKTFRVLTIIWIQAHYKMASGRTEPAEWFDVQDAGTAALKLIF